MRKKAISILLCLSLMLLFVLPAFAQDVTTFGFTPTMARYNQDMSEAPVLVPSWRSDVGTSYSQPLILDGTQLGQSTPVVIAAAGGYLYGWVCPSTLNPSMDFQQNDYKWRAQLAGDTPTTSHPTLVTINGKKIVFIGSALDSGAGGAWLQAIDITNGFNPVLSALDQNASDIVSAPLVTQWNGHWIAVYTTGNSGQVDIMTGLDGIGTQGFDASQVATYKLQLTGRTSSTPIGVMYQNGYPTGFAVGVDGGQSSGEVRVYRFDDILSVDGNGSVVLSNQTPVIMDNFQSGIAASFSASDDGNNIYFGDTNSRMYSLNVPSNALNWKNTDIAGNFSNRSPALSPANVYFSSGTSPGTTGMVISIDRNTGATIAKWPYTFAQGASAQTAPSIWPSTLPGTGSSVFVGSGQGDILQIDADYGTLINTQNFTDSSGTSYASGITGEISLGNGYMVVTTNNGILAWSVISPPDMQAVSIDPGCPQVNGVYTAQPGQTYTATVTYNCINQQNGNAPSYSDYPMTPVAAFQTSGNTTTKDVLLDSNGQPVPLTSVNNLDGSTMQSQTVDMKPGQGPVKYTFTWSANASAPSINLAAAINVNYPDSSPQIKQVMPEINLANNVVSVPVSVIIPNNLNVQITNYPAQVYSGDPIPVTAMVTNTSGKYVMTDLQWKVNGGLVKDEPKFDLVTSQGDTYTMTAPNVNQKTTYTFEVDVNPGHDRPPDETSWADNIATCTVTVLPRIMNPGGDLEMWIDAPDFVDNSPWPKPWDYTVWVHIPYIPEPPEGSSPPPVILTLNVSTTGGQRGDNYSYSTGKQDISPIEPSWQKQISLGRGNDAFDMPVQFTFPWSGVWGQGTEVHIKASGGISEPVDKGGEADKIVQIGPKPIPGKKQILTQ